jgi:hypothetical protein
MCVSATISVASLFGCGNLGLVRKRSASSDHEGQGPRDANYATEADILRGRLRAVMAHFNLSQTAWCQRAGFENTSALGNFLAARDNGSRSLHLYTLKPLAKAVGLFVSHFTGELPFPWETKSNREEVSDRAAAPRRPIQQVRVEIPGGATVIVETSEPEQFVRSLLSAPSTLTATTRQ